jgi:hypothetical protein
MRRRELLASMIAACTLSGCVGNHEVIPGKPEETDNSEEPDDQAEPEEPEEPEEGERVEIIESVLIRENVGTDEETASVGGVVTARESVEVSYVEIRASFYDGEGELLDTTIEQVEIDAETDRWEFDIMYPQVGEQAAEVDEYELEVGTEL